MWVDKLLPWVTGVAPLLLCLACSSESESNASVAGQWCGVSVVSPEACVGDEVEYLDLEQSGTQVTGKICEAYEKDCAPLIGGRLDDGRLTFRYSPEVVRGVADFRLNDDLLQGQIYSAKCGCELPFTFHRL